MNYNDSINLHIKNDEIVLYSPLQFLYQLFPSSNFQNIEKLLINHRSRVHRRSLCSYRTSWCPYLLHTRNNGLNKSIYKNEPSLKTVNHLLDSIFRALTASCVKIKRFRRTICSSALITRLRNFINASLLLAGV